MFFNPAGLTRQTHYEVLANLTYIVPESRFKHGSASTVQGVAITGLADPNDIGDNELIPAFYAMVPVSDLRFGLGVNIPFGLSTSYEDGWIGRYYALDSQLTSVNINPVTAVRVTDWLSVGAGVQIQYIDAKLSNAIDFGTIGAVSVIPGSLPTLQDGKVKFSGNDWGSGYNLGVLFTPTADTRFGIAYRSEIEHGVSGNANFRSDSAGIGAALSAATGRFVDSDASANATTPATFSLGTYHDINKQWAVMGEFAWTNWSEFNEIRVEFDNPAEPDNVTEQEWHDTFFVALGATWRPSDGLAIRGGVAFDKSPVKNKFRNPRQPSGDRYWLSMGLDYAVANWLGLSASFTHVYNESSDIDLTTDGADNTFRGNLSGRVESHTNMGTFSATLRF